MAARNSGNRQNAYVVDGNTVRRVRAAGTEREQQRLRVIERKKVKAEKRAMNVAYLFFLTASLAAGALALSYYLMLQTEVSASATRISSLEKQLSALTKENDETYNYINGNIDLEEIRRIAIQEYGMRYVEEGQIITYSDGGGSDYVRQSADIPQAGK